LGLSERRFGHFLHNHTRDDYVLSTKVGRILKASETLPRMMWKDPSPFSYEYDYTAAGVRRSVEDSLQRLGISRIDIVFIHDLSPDNAQYGTDLRTAALQFCNAPPTVSVVTPGARDAQQARENAASMQTQIPPEFWTTLKREGLIAENAPVPQTA
jgi:aryl-alcohol dehydrogenase-like predicted oxidoreductase